MMRTLTLLSLLLVGQFAYSTTYTTIANGSWDNTTDVWSTDGVNPCLCSPSLTVDGDDIVIEHIINVSAGTLLLTGDATMAIREDGALEAANSTLDVRIGTFYAAGDVELKKLLIGLLGTFEVNTAELIVHQQVRNRGNFTIYFANVLISNGNIETGVHGTTRILEGSKVYFTAGNFNNDGLTEVSGGSCIEIGTGNIKNNTGATMTGDGSLITVNGNVQNDGTWDPALVWCSAGTDFGMPSAEDCLNANANCQFAPLPVEIVSFTGEAKKGRNDIHWISATELNCDYYILERSENGRDWETIAVVDGAGTTDQKSTYKVEDMITKPKLYYYRLLQFDFNADEKEAGVISVESLRAMTVCVYPNPTDGQFTILIDEEAPEMNVKIYTLNGEEVHSLETAGSKVQIEPELDSGVYIISVQRGNKVETVKLVVR